MEKNKLVIKKEDGTEKQMEKALVVEVKGENDATVHFFDLQQEDFTRIAFSLLAVMDEFGIRDAILETYENEMNYVCKINGGKGLAGTENEDN